MTGSASSRAPDDAATAGGRPPSRVVVRWAGEQRFDAGRPDGPTLRVDGTGATGQSPVDALLSALGSCAAIDVVEILAKRRTPVERMEIDITGERVDTIPRRLRAVVLEFRIDGSGIERVHAERAIGLSIEKYCSVRDSLARDIAIDWRLVLNGEGRGT